ncbi:hypothetical protein BGZ76_003690, partial [Entomortierella beljakovae]
MTELNDEKALLSELDELTDRRTFVIVRLPKRDSKRQREDDESNTSRKSPKHESQATDDLVRLVPNLIQQVSDLSQRVSKRQLDDAEPDTSQKALKSDRKPKLDQSEVWYRFMIPDVDIDWGSVKLACDTNAVLSLKDAIIGDSKELQLHEKSRIILAATKQVDDPKLAQPLDTRQSLRDVLDNRNPSSVDFNDEDPIQKVLAGPMGVGKSYLAIFLAAKAYAEGWLSLYIADAGEIAKDEKPTVSKEICMRVFALNKDILTTRDLQDMVIYSKTINDAANVNYASSNILGSVLRQRTKKSLVIIDEHHEEVMLQATDISGTKKELLTFKIRHNRMLTDPPSE